MNFRNIIHIGRHKTGSTALQNFLNCNKAELAALGIAFPVPLSLHADLAVQLLYEQGTPLPDDIAHRFPWLKLPQEFPSQRLESLARDSQLSQTLISCEGFCNVYPATMAKHFNPSSSLILAYIREQLEYLLSAYAQAIQETKRTYSFAQFEKEIYLNYVPFVDQWANVFGGNVWVRIYEKEALVDGDIRNDFLHALGHENKTNFKFTESGTNPSIGGPLLQFKLLLNRVSPWPVERLMPATYRVLGALAEQEPRFRQKLILPEHEAQRIRKKYAVCNAELARRLRSHHKDKDVFQFTELGGDADQQKLKESDFENIMQWFQTRAPEFHKEHFTLLAKHL